MKENKWNLEKVKKLKELIESRNHVVKVSSSDLPVCLLALNPDPEKYQSLGDIAFAGEGRSWDQTPETPIEDYQPEDFQVYKEIKWL